MNTPADQPYCGAEMLPHMTAPDGTASPLICDLKVHGRDVMHRNDERDSFWAWQDADGKWLPRR